MNKLYAEPEASALELQREAREGKGRMDAFVSALALLIELGPQMESESYELGLEHGREESKKPLGY